MKVNGLLDSVGLHSCAPVHIKNYKLKAMLSSNLKYYEADLAEDEFENIRKAMNYSDNGRKMALEKIKDKMKYKIKFNLY